MRLKKEKLATIAWRQLRIHEHGSGSFIGRVPSTFPRRDPRFVRQFDNAGMAEGRTIFDVEAKLSEVFSRHADDRDVAESEDLDPRLFFLALERREFGAHRPKNAGDHFSPGWRVFATV